MTTAQDIAAELGRDWIDCGAYERMAFEDEAQRRMIVCETCGGDGSFDRVVGHDQSGPVWQDSFCPTCQGAGEYAVKVEPVTIDDISN